MLKKLACLTVVLALCGAGGTVLPAKIKVKPTALVFHLRPPGAPAVACLKQDNQIIAGTLSKNKKVFTPLKAQRQIQILKLKDKIEDAADEIEIARLKAKIKKYKREMKSSQALCAKGPPPVETPVTCLVSANPQSFVLNENETAEITLGASSTCEGEFTYELASRPAAGTAFVEEKKLFYRAGFNATSDSFKARACQAEICSGDVEITVSGTPAEFVGRADSLEPYRKNISRAEAKHLIKKLALNDVAMLSDDLKIEGGYSLEALVNKMLDPHYVSSDLKRQLEIFRDATPDPGEQPIPLQTAWRAPYRTNFFSPAEQFDTPAKQVDAFERFQHHFFTGYNSTANPPGVSADPPWGNLHYVYYDTPAITFMRPRYLSPTWELMTNFWYGHFGTAVHTMGGDRDEYHVRDYIDLIAKNAIGNFKELMLGTNPEACKSEGEGRGILCDAAGNRWLNNNENTYLNRNQNFGREFMELYLLGPADQSSGVQNYNEDDVVASTAFLSGYQIQLYSGIVGEGAPAPIVNIPITREKLVFNPTRHDFAEYTAFANTKYEFSGSHTPWEWTEHLIENHPGTPRFIAGKIFRMLAYRDPSEKMVQALAERFRASGFDLADLLFAIATSEAMFSDKAIDPKCVKEPFRQFTEVLRNIQLPYIDNWVYSNQNSNRFNSINAYTVDRLLTAMSVLGESPLLYDSVFTYDYCGRKPEEHGDTWLASIYMLQRTKVIIEFLANSDWANQKVFDFNNILLLMLKPGETLAAATPSRVIDYYKDMYNVPLSESERTIIYDYMTTRLNAQDIPLDTGWNPFDRNMVSEKLAGLTVIFASMSQSNIH